MVMERVVSVIRPAAAPTGVDSTDIALLVSTNSQQEINTWDRSRIAVPRDLTHEALGEHAEVRREAKEGPGLVHPQRAGEGEVAVEELQLVAQQFHIPGCHTQGRPKIVRGHLQHLRLVTIQLLQGCNLFHRDHPA